MRISDWSSYVCSSDLSTMAMPKKAKITSALLLLAVAVGCVIYLNRPESSASTQSTDDAYVQADFTLVRSEEHTSELQSLMRISYAVFCLQKKKNTSNNSPHKPEHTTSPTKHIQQFTSNNK